METEEFVFSFLEDCASVNWTDYGGTSQSNQKAFVWLVHYLT